MAEVEGMDAEVGSLLCSGKVKFRGLDHQIFLTQSGLRLVTTREGSKPNGVNGVPFDLSWRDVVCACEATVKKTKAQTKNKPGLDDSTQGNAFSVHYIAKDKKTNKKQCKNFVLELESAEGPAEAWISQIDKKCKEGKPRKLLIIINPIGGKGTAQQMFNKYVQPLFALAGVDLVVKGVELVVKVTERYQHAIEITKTFDLASVDGVISMGGDGLYMEILHGLTLRKQEEEGVEFNDPEAKLVPPTVCVGIIPAGTGNGVCSWFNGVIDMDTSVLNIIRGKTNRSNIFSIHAQGRLIHYSGFLFANGFFSSLMKKTADLRWMKRARYPYAMLASLFQRKKILEYDIEVLKSDILQKNSEDGAMAKGDETAAAQAWTKLGTKQLTATFAYVARILDGPGLLEMSFFHSGFHLIILDKASALENIKFIYGIAIRKREELEREYVEQIPNILGVRFEPTQNGTCQSSSSQEHLELCKMLDVDGEVIGLPEPKFEVRLHPQFLQVFCDTEYLSLRKTTEP